MERNQWPGWSGIRRLMRIYLTVLGYEIKAALNGEEAIRLLDTGVKIDFVVTDIAMPGTNGNDVAKYIRKSQIPDLPIVAITGATGDIDEGLFNSILVKPYRLRKLAEEIASLARRSV
jgi:CheY-like chemotaxis protein